MHNTRENAILVLDRIKSDEKYVRELFKSFNRGDKYPGRGYLIIRVKGGVPLCVPSDMIRIGIEKRILKSKDKSEFNCFKDFLITLIGESIELNVDIDEIASVENEMQESCN